MLVCRRVGLVPPANAAQCAGTGDVSVGEPHRSAGSDCKFHNIDYANRGCRPSLERSVLPPPPLEMSLMPGRHLGEVYDDGLVDEPRGDRPVACVAGCYCRADFGSGSGAVHVRDAASSVFQPLKLYRSDGPSALRSKRHGGLQSPQSSFHSRAGRDHAPPRPPARDGFRLSGRPTRHQTQGSGAARTDTFACRQSTCPSMVPWRAFNLLQTVSGCFLTRPPSRLRKSA